MPVAVLVKILGMGTIQQIGRVCRIGGAYRIETARPEDKKKAYGGTKELSPNKIYTLAVIGSLLAEQYNSSLHEKDGDGDSIVSFVHLRLLPLTDKSLYPVVRLQ